jgi:hypothetical protein
LNTANETVHKAIHKGTTMEAKRKPKALLPRTRFRAILIEEALTINYVAKRTGFAHVTLRALARGDGWDRFSHISLTKIAAVLNRTKDEVFPEIMQRPVPVHTPDIRVGVSMLNKEPVFEATRAM